MKQLTYPIYIPIFKSLLTIDDGVDEIKELLESHRLKDVDNPRYTNQAYLSMFNTHTAFKRG